MFKFVFPTNTLQAATSFDCDGCNHHASFHALENPKEDEVMRKWAEQQAQEQQQQTAMATKKRKLLTQAPGSNQTMAGSFPDAELMIAGASRPKAKGRRKFNSGDAAPSLDLTGD
jgi:hypothetical protein